MVRACFLIGSGGEGTPFAGIADLSTRTEVGETIQGSLPNDLFWTDLQVPMLIPLIPVIEIVKFLYL
jgi:hypothetical protein